MMIKDSHILRLSFMGKVWRGILKNANYCKYVDFATS